MLPSSFERAELFNDTLPCTVICTTANDSEESNDKSQPGQDSNRSFPRESRWQYVSFKVTLCGLPETERIRKLKIYIMYFCNIFRNCTDTALYSRG